MAFTAHADVAGIPDFKVIDIDPQEVAKALQLYLQRGSKLTGVSIEDISTAVSILPPAGNKATLVDLLQVGMKLFDAIVWITANRPAERPLTVSPTLTKDKIPSLHEVARSVFYVYFFLLTQARYPGGSTTTDKPKVPNFLKQIMGMDKDQSYYMDLICSFTPQKFDPHWVESVSFRGLGQEALSRFGLGVAGYRLFGPFKLYNVRKDLPAELTNAVAFAKQVSRSPPTWSIHPLTRNPAVLTKRGNLNKNLGNLILKAFTEEQIDEMVNSKILYAKPKHEATALNFTTWTPDDDISGANQIFRTPQA